MDVHGVGPVVAARVLADVGDVTRFADRNRFASWTGTAPLDASSGEQNRHRVSRAGNRRMNHMIHIAAISQIRLDTDGRAYYRSKRAEGKKPLEAIRCRKRRISDAIYRHLLETPTAPPTMTWHRPGRALRGDSSIQRGRLAPAHRHFGSATSRTREADATPTITRSEDPPQSRALTQRGARSGSSAQRRTGVRADRIWAIATVGDGVYAGRMVVREAALRRWS